MQIRRFITIALASSVLLGVCMLAPAQAETDAKKSTVAKRKKTAAPKFINSSSQETTRERERRLLRECKGRANAGACAGFTG